jgi:hypothetical protein
MRDLSSRASDVIVPGDAHKHGHGYAVHAHAHGDCECVCAFVHVRMPYRGQDADDKHENEYSARVRLLMREHRLCHARACTGATLISFVGVNATAFA